MKKKIGDILYNSAIALIAVVGLLFIIKKELISLRVALLVGSSAIFMDVISFLLTDKTWMAGRAIEREKEPGWFWTIIVSYCLFGVGLIIAAFFGRAANS